jgi:hypothetical protein
VQCSVREDLLTNPQGQNPRFSESKPSNFQVVLTSALGQCYPPKRCNSPFSSVSFGVAAFCVLSLSYTSSPLTCIAHRSLSPPPPRDNTAPCVVSLQARQPNGCALTTVTYQTVHLWLRLGAWSCAVVHRITLCTSSLVGTTSLQSPTSQWQPTLRPRSFVIHCAVA